MGPYSAAHPQYLFQPEYPPPPGPGPYFLVPGGKFKQYHEPRQKFGDESGYMTTSTYTAD